MNKYKIGILVCILAGIILNSTVLSIGNILNVDTLNVKGGIDDYSNNSLDNSRIESKKIYDDPNGLNIILYIYDRNYNTYRYKGTLEIVLFEKNKDIDGNFIKGKELDRWNLQIQENDYGIGNELFKTLKFHNNKISSSTGYGWIEYVFTQKHGHVFLNWDTYVPLLNNSEKK